LHLTAATNDVAERPDNKVAEMEKKILLPDPLHAKNHHWLIKMQ